MNRCYLGIGSNLRSPERQLRKALLLLKNIPKSVLIKTSLVYKSRPLLRSQPYYRNLVVEIATALPPHQLLHYTQNIEQQLKRTHKKRWGSRTIDIDLLLYNKSTINHPYLKIPHPEILFRDFVMVPLVKIAPFAELPNGDAIVNHLSHCQQHLIYSKLS